MNRDGKDIIAMTAKKNFTLIFIILFTLLLSASVWPVAPTKEAIEKWKADGVLEEKINNWKNERKYSN